jgi:hypothetical protein
MARLLLVLTTSGGDGAIAWHRVLRGALAADGDAGEGGDASK